MKPQLVSPSSGPAIRAVNLARNLAGVDAVQDASFTASYGRILGLLGPNGAGKTTTLKMLACLLEPTGGTLEICGQPAQVNPDETKKHIGFMTSGMKLYESFTPEESLFYFGRLRGMEESRIRARVDELAAEFEMGAFMRKRYGKLSSGEQQRTTIANAILHDPRILIFDEITLSLDIPSTASILQHVRKERDKGRCVVFSTHSMGEAEYLCDDIALINQGRVICQSTAAELLQSTHSSNLTEAFLKKLGLLPKAAA